MTGKTSIARTGLIGLSGAILATAVGLPAAALIGASLATSLAAWAGLRLQVPAQFRNLGFTIVGLSLGSGITPTTFSELGAWGFSLAMLGLSLICTLIIGSKVLARSAGLRGDTALLAASPGTMSYALALAEDMQVDRIAVLVVQSMRLLLLASAVPLIVQPFIDPADMVQIAASGLGAAQVLALTAAALGLGWAMERLRSPAAYLLAGFILSAVLHLAGWIEGRPPGWALFLGFTIIGSVIGARFSGMELSRLARHARGTLISVGVATLVSMLFAVMVAGVSDLPFAQTWIAFAPGGVEAMAAIGLAMGYDPAYIAIHHLTRIVVLMLLLPLLLGRRGIRS